MVRQGRGGKVRSSKLNAAQLFFCCLLVSELAHTNAQAGFPGIWEAGKSGHGQGRAGWAQGRGCMAEWGWSGSTMSRAGRRGEKTWDVWPGWARPVHRWSVWLVCEVHGGTGTRAGQMGLTWSHMGSAGVVRASHGPNQASKHETCFPQAARGAWRHGQGWGGQGSWEGMCVMWCGARQADWRRGGDRAVRNRHASRGRADGAESAWQEARWTRILV